MGIGAAPPEGGPDLEVSCTCVCPSLFWGLVDSTYLEGLFRGRTPVYHQAVLSCPGGQCGTAFARWALTPVWHDPTVALWSWVVVRASWERVWPALLEEDSPPLGPGEQVCPSSCWAGRQQRLGRSQEGTSPLKG